MTDPGDWRLALTAFTTVFVAELGDKTQVATLLLAADQPSARWWVFVGAATALVLAAAIGVLAGSWVQHYLPERTLKFVAGLLFIVLGLWTLRAAMIPGGAA